MSKLLKHFDIEYYKNKYPELKNFSKYKITNHFLNIGLREKRIFNKNLENFNLIEYKNIFPECRDMSYIKVCNHYLDNNSNKNLNNKKEIINKKIFNPNNLYFEQIDFFNDNIFNFKSIYSNIDLFDKFIEDYHKILFICEDWPGWGGAATNCYNLQLYYKNLNHETFGFYFNSVNYKEQNLDYIVDNYDKIFEINFKPDLIILKSPVYKFNIKNIFKCPIIFLVPGLYTNLLNQFYYSIKSTFEHNLFLHPTLIKTLKYSDYIFCNSKHTQNIIKNYFYIDSYLFYSSLINYKDKYPIIDIDFDNRYYDYGIIMNDFKRKIKNAEKSINYVNSLINKNNNLNVILIGKNCKLYNVKNATYIDLVDNNKLNYYYKKIKYVIQDSFYESCSNVKIESIFNGCCVINSNNELENEMYDNQLESENIKSENIKSENIKSNKYIVISSTQYPGFGGAATNAYQLIKEFRRKGYYACGLFFNNEINVNYNPDNINGIFLYTYNYNKHIILKNIYNYFKNYPNLCLAKNYLAPIFCKDIFNCATIYLVSGINHFSYYDNLSAIEILNENFIINIKNNNEILTNKISDKIIVNSELTYKIFKKIYPEFSYKLLNPIDTTVCIEKLDEIYYKTYDIILICSDYKRKNKNYLFLENILLNDKIKSFKKLIIGKNNNLFNKIDNCTFLPLQSHKKCIEYIAMSKILLHPALFESNSNTIREAYYHKCLPIITRNVGYNELFPEFLICNNFNENEWINKIYLVLNNYENYKNTNINFTNELNIELLLDSI